MATPTPTVLDVPCFAGDLDSAAAFVVERACAREGGYACLANAHVMATATRDIAVKRALDDAWTVFPDGMPVAWMLRQAGHREARRVPGPDLMPRVISLGREHRLRHYLLGGTPAVSNALQLRIERDSPGALIAGASSPPFSDPLVVDVDAIRAADPHIVWCAFGAPRQEIWMRKHYGILAPSVLLGVGAAFDFASGAKRRAPVWMQGAALEWLHRTAQEPLRLGPRYLRSNSTFLVRAGRQLVTERTR